MQLAIVGFGEMGKRHGRDFIEFSRGKVKLQAVVEPDDVCYEEGCKWTGCRPARYDSVKAMLAREKPNGVIIASPNHTHLDNLRNLEQAAVPLLLEKPLDSSFERICEVVRFSRRYPAPIMVHHVMRYAPIVQKARELITSGVLGNVCSAHFMQTIRGDGLFHDFRRNTQTGGGHLLEKATHDLDIMLFLMDRRPLRVSSLSFQHAYGGNKPDTLRCRDCDERTTCREYSAKGMVSHTDLRDVATANDLCAFAKTVNASDNETCVILLEDNKYGVYSHCFYARGLTSREYQVLGTEGCMRIIFSEVNGPADGRIILTPRYEDPLQGRIQEFKFSYHKRIHYNGAPGVVAHFTELMFGAKQPFTTVEDAFMAELIGCAAYSASDGAFVDLNKILPPDLALNL